MIWADTIKKLNFNFFSWLLLGTIFGIGAPVCYYFDGQQMTVILLWVASLILVGVYFYLQDVTIEANNDFKMDNIFCMFICMLVFAPIYLFLLYWIPYQINSDEVTIMLSMTKFSNNPHLSLFGVDGPYFAPSFIFVIFGSLGKLLGGINLQNIRFVHAIFGLLTIGISYQFFRLILPSRLMAIGGSFLIGSHHVFLAISRMAMRDNTVLLSEFLALLFLYTGFKRNSPLFNFLGGVMAGLCYYGYYPGRIIIFLWLFYLGLIWFIFQVRDSMAHIPSRSKIIKIALINIFGFTLVVAPIGVSILKKMERGKSPFVYQKAQLLMFPEARKLQQSRSGAATIAAGIKKNIVQGLTVFNNRLVDQGRIYVNQGHGFVDPLSGFLIWVGVFLSLYKLNQNVESMLALSSFLAILMVNSFLVNKAPNYTRYLIILPFTAFFIIQALSKLAEVLVKSFVYLGKNFFTPSIGLTQYLKNIILGLGISLIGIWNFMIFGDYAMQGLVNGNDIGGTARYIESKKNKAKHTFYLAADRKYLYYRGGQDFQWKSWAGFFTNDHKPVKILDPKNIVEELGPTPFSIFMSQRLWFVAQDSLKDAYPELITDPIVSDGRLIVVEVEK